MGDVPVCYRTYKQWSAFMRTPTPRLFVKNPVKLGLIVSFLSISLLAFAQDNEEDGQEPDGQETESSQPMTAERLGELVLRVDDSAEQQGNQWGFSVAELPIILVFDATNDRMRLMTPIGDATALSQEQLARLMQANFDTALDARYAIAGGLLWGTFIHPLSALSDEQFLVAIGQVANVSLSYGESFSSGLLMFGGGDTGQRQRELIDQLRKKQNI